MNTDATAKGFHARASRRWFIKGLKAMMKPIPHRPLDAGFNHTIRLDSVGAPGTLRRAASATKR